VVPSDSKSPSSSSNSPNTSSKVSSPLKRRKGSSNDSDNSGKDNKFKLEDVEKTAELDESKLFLQ